MPTKKNRGTEGRNHAIFSVGESLGQPSHGIGTPTPVECLYDAIQNGSPVHGGSKSAVGQLAHGTGDVPNKVSLPKHSGKKTRGLYPRSSD
jgi:hypothetical protein